MCKTNNFIYNFFAVSSYALHKCSLYKKLNYYQLHKNALMKG